ncbi:MAG: hypothetical protein GX627_01595 [Parcubacteria group bacterium]|nr:hypothetical protein [Parcubacteria group bacterium]
MKKMDQYKFERGFNIKRFVIILSVIMLVSYGLFNARDLLIGPTIEIFSPTKHTIETDSNVLTISGKTKNIAFISLNEKPISIDTEGVFQEKLLLSPGSNTIEIKGKDRFKQETKKVVKIYYKQNTVLTETKQSSTTPNNS